MSILQIDKLGVVRFVNTFLDGGKDILHALLVFTTLLMGFVMNQFLSMLTNSSDHILCIFLILMALVDI